MVLVIVFVALGVLAAAALSPVHPDPLGVTGVLHRLGHGTVADLLDGVPVAEPTTTVVTVLAGTLLPGLVLLLLAEAVKAGAGLRRVACVAVLVGALFSFTVLPPPQATGLLFVAVLVAVGLSVATRFLVAPVAFVLGYAAAGYVLSLVSGADVALHRYAGQLQAHLHLGVDVWTLLLTMLAASPVAAAAVRLLRSN